jgi:hypothetical protein
MSRAMSRDFREERKEKEKEKKLNIKTRDT